MSDVSDLFEARDDHVVINVHVQPCAGRSAVVGRHGDALKVRVAAPPADGRANEAARSLLAETFGVGPSAVVLVSGAASRVKRFRVDGVEAADVEARLRRAIAAAGNPGPGPRR